MVTVLAGWVEMALISHENIQNYLNHLHSEVCIYAKEAISETENEKLGEKNTNNIYIQQKVRTQRTL